MTTFPSPALAPDVAQRLLADWDKTHEDLLALIAVHEAREWSREEELQHMRLARAVSRLSRPRFTVIIKEPRSRKTSAYGLRRKAFRMCKNPERKASRKGWMPVKNPLPAPVRRYQHLTFLPASVVCETRNRTWLTAS